MSENTVNSALLTATIKSLKIQQSMQSSVKMIHDENQEISKKQSDILTALSVLDDMPRVSDIEALRSDIKANYELLSNLNLPDVERDIISALDTHMSTMTDQNDGNTKKLNQAIEKSNNIEILKTISDLIRGLKVMQGNMEVLATRVDDLSKNVKTISSDYRTMSSTIIDSNARVNSMDMRMAALIGESLEKEDGPVKISSSSKDDIGDAIAFIEDFASQQSDDDTE